MHLNTRCCQCKHWNRYGDTSKIGRCELLPKFPQEVTESNYGCGSSWKLSIEQLKERYGPEYVSIVTELSK